jgi:hypothetical protein
MNIKIETSAYESKTRLILTKIFTFTPLQGYDEDKK